MVIVAVLLLALPAHAAAQVIWPGKPPCGGPLQDCINQIPAGTIVEIAINGPIDASVEIDKSLTLRAAAGFTPVFRESHSVSAVAATQGDRTITIEGVTIERGSIRASQIGSGAFTISIVNNTVQNTMPGATAAIEVSIGNSQATHGSTTFDVSGNSITVDADPMDLVHGIFVCCFLGGGNAGTIAHNVLSHRGGMRSSAIEVSNNNVDLTVDIIGNQVFGMDFNKGIEVDQSGSGGNTTARILNNLVSGQVNFAAGPAAIALRATRGTGHFEVINNTVADNEQGLLVSARPDLDAVLTGFMANNVVAFNEAVGLNLEEGITDAFENRFNLFFGNGSDLFTPGPGTIVADPQFVAAGDYRLRPSSPAVNAGNTADVPADLATELDGNPRVAQGRVDCGAYERQPGCAGDCDGDGAVAINELILGVNIALGQRSVDGCRAFDINANGSVAIDELIAAVNAALGGCATPHTPTATRTQSSTRTGTATPTAIATETRTAGPTRTRTPGMSCGASAPECFGTCPIRRICEPNDTGGCHCVLVDEM